MRFNQEIESPEELKRAVRHAERRLAAKIVLILVVELLETPNSSICLGSPAGHMPADTAEIWSLSPADVHPL